MESIVQRIITMKIVNSLIILILRIMAVRTFLVMNILNVPIVWTKRTSCLKDHQFHCRRKGTQLITTQLCYLMIPTFIVEKTTLHMKTFIKRVKNMDLNPVS